MFPQSRQARLLAYLVAVTVVMAVIAALLSIQIGDHKEASRSTQDLEPDRQIGPNARQTTDPAHVHENDVMEPASGKVPAVAEESSSRNRLLENIVLEFFSRQPGLELTSLQSVECGIDRCEIVFTGVEANPQYVDAHSNLLNDLTWDLMRRYAEDFLPSSGSTSLREIAPGANAFFMSFSYVTYEPLSDDPEGKARQYAACAAVRKRMAAQAESRGDEGTGSALREEAEQYLDMASRTIGRAAAETLADRINGGALIRDCRWLTSTTRLAEWPKA